MTAQAGPELALEAAELLAACTLDSHDRALIEQLIRTHREGGKMPSAAILPPLAQVAARILAGDGTDEAAQYWLRSGLVMLEVRARRAAREHYHDAEPDVPCTCARPGTYAAQAIPGTLVREGHPGGMNDPERFPGDM